MKSTHDVFKRIILSELLAIAERAGVMENISSISLYGSTNYEPYNQSFSPRNPEAGEQDYDIWIVFKRKCLAQAQEFATKLFGVDFKSLQDQSACILYDKIRLRIAGSDFLLAPMLVTEESYELLQGDSMVSKKDVLIPWYRSRARERPPKVPVCCQDHTWSEFDMQQVYLIGAGLWQLMMPIVIHQNGKSSLGTFVECALSGDCFYGDSQKENDLKQNLFFEVIRHLRLQESFSTSDIPSKVYQMMTLCAKVGSNFRARKIDQFSQWLSR